MTSQDHSELQADLGIELGVPVTLSPQVIPLENLSFFLLGSACGGATPSLPGEFLFNLHNPTLCEVSLPQIQRRKSLEQLLLGISAAWGLGQAYG